MATKRLVIAFAWAFANGCSCEAAGRPDAGAPGDAPADAEWSTSDARGVLDASVDARDQPDAFLSAPICGPILATACPTQRQDEVSACATGEGAVFFDGAHCQQTASSACGPERGAFRSFEECAFVCEAAGHCDASKITYSNPFGPATCETPVGPPVVCGGGARMLVHEPGVIGCALFRDSFVECDDNVPHRCSFESAPIRSWNDVWLPFRRASLLPFVSELACDLGGP